MHLHIISIPSSVSIGFLLCAGTLVVWWHVVVVGWVRIGVHRGCGLVGFWEFPFNMWGQHPTTYVYNALCVLMFEYGWAWLVRWLGLGLAS